MASKRRGWNALSAAYRSRLIRHGITEESYSQGANIRAARGHRSTPEHGRSRSGWAAIARSHSIHSFLPMFDALPRSEQERIGEAWIKGHWQKWNGPPMSPAERSRRGISKRDRKLYRRQSDAQVGFQMDFDQAYYELNQEEEWGSNEWKRFRAEYSAHFTAA
jgi:hypothetical protein